MTTTNETQMIAFADQVQALVQDQAEQKEGLDVILFALVTSDGYAEIRSPLPEETIKELLTTVAQEF